MKRLNTTNITPSIGAPIKSGSLDFIFDSISECSAASLISRIEGLGNTYSSTIPYILYGLDYAVGFAAANLPEAIVFFNGEIFYSPLQTLFGAGFTSASVVTADIETVSITGANADPVQFFGPSAGLYSIHDYRRIKFRLAGGATPQIDYLSNFKRIGLGVTNLSKAAVVTVKFKKEFTNLDDVNSTYPSYTFGYDFTNAVIGSRTVLYFGLPTTGTTFTFPNSGSMKTLINGRVNGFSMGSGSITSAAIEFRYIGKDVNNFNVVIVNVYSGV